MASYWVNFAYCYAVFLGCRFDFVSVHTLVTRDTVQSGDSFFGAQVEALPGASDCHSRYNPSSWFLLGPVACLPYSGSLFLRCATHSSTLKMEAAGFSEMSVPTYQTAWCQNAVDCHIPAVRLVLKVEYARDSPPPREYFGFPPSVYFTDFVNLGN